MLFRVLRIFQILIIDPHGFTIIFTYQTTSLAPP